MTITYDPHHPLYVDESDVRGELSRVSDLCHSCQRCVDLCTTFPSLFEMIGQVDGHDAGLLTPAQQDRVVDQCFHCKLCYVNCPYVPGQSDRAIDFPRLMLRAHAMRHRTGQQTLTSRASSQVLGRTDLVGRFASRLAPVVNKPLEAKAGSWVRRTMARATGVSSVRLLPPYARQRFSTWFRTRPAIHHRTPQAKVTVYPTCVVEYQAPGVGRDLVRVYERNGIECGLSTAGCCGAPWLHAGDVEHFIKVATKNAAALAAEVRRGTEIVVPQPTCGYVLKQDYVDYVGGGDAELVAANTYDAAEYLVRLHKGADTSLDTRFAGDVPASITYHAPCHLRAQNAGLRSRDLLKLTGAKVALVQQCSGIDGMWGLRAENESVAIPVAAELGAQITRAAGDVVAGDCHLANTAITEQTGVTPLHPLQLIARAYGIADDD
jgi:glycerol-3-phosphate dehydrogenase subunit C